MNTLPTEFVLSEILSKLPLKYTFRFKCVSKSYRISISTLCFLDTLFSNILPRLPIKPLLRFKCVSKAFQSKISCPEFTTLHLSISASSDANRMLILNRQPAGAWQSSLHCLHVDSLDSPPVRLVLPEHFAKKGRLRTFGCCNGVLCIGHTILLRSSCESFMLINPSTGSSFAVHPAKDHRLGCRRHVTNVGFGYDSETDDYKIVQIVEYDNQGTRIQDVLVYSLKANSWKVVESTSPTEHYIESNDSGALINNHLLHWLFSSSPYRIACFDLTKQGWVQDVPLPDYDEDLSYHLSVVSIRRMDEQYSPAHYSGVYDGCLCLLTRELSCIKRVNVWVMKEYGVKESWVKLLGVSDPPCTRSLHTYPLCYRDNGSIDEISVASGGDCGMKFKLMLHKITGKQSKSVEARTIHESNHRGIIEAYICHGSLVTLPGGDQIGKAAKP